MKKSTKIISLFFVIQIILICTHIPSAIAADVIYKNKFEKEMIPVAAIRCVENEEDNDSEKCEHHNKVYDHTDRDGTRVFECPDCGETVTETGSV